MKTHVEGAGRTRRHELVACYCCGGVGQTRVWSGQYLRETRERCGVSLRAVARHVGLSAPYVCDLELGRRRLSEQLFGALERAIHAEKKQ